MANSIFFPQDKTVIRVYFFTQADLGISEEKEQMWSQAKPLFEQLKQSPEEINGMWIPDSAYAGWLAGAVVIVSAVSPAQAAGNYAYGVCRTAIPSMGAEASIPGSAGDRLAFAFVGFGRGTVPHRSHTSPAGARP